MEYWKQYNLKLLDIASSMVLHNKHNLFNFVEDSFYNHIRDLIAMTIAMSNANKESIIPMQILDYGSNQTVWANISNKIDTSLINVTIFDPFFDPLTPNIDSDFDMKTLSSIEDLGKKKYDLVIYGSVAQYEENFISNIDPCIISETNYILFTHTPMSLKETFRSKQFSGYKDTQIIHSYQDISDRFEKLDYSLIFKSTLPQKEASVEEKFVKDIVYANLLFIKK